MHLHYIIDFAIFNYMKELFEKLFEQLDDVIAQYEKNNDLTLQKTHITIMGQLALLLHPEAKLDQLDLAATRDLDAIVKGANQTFLELKKQLEKIHFIYDMDSEKIWLPQSYTTIHFYHSSKLVVDIVDPIFILISKALKAKEKNKKLMQQALKIFGKELKEKLTKEGADLAYFQK